MLGDILTGWYRTRILNATSIVYYLYSQRHLNYVILCFSVHEKWVIHGPNKSTDADYIHILKLFQGAYLYKHLTLGIVIRDHNICLNYW